MKNKGQKYRGQVMLTKEQHRHLTQHMSISDKLRDLIDLDIAINTIAARGLTISDMNMYIKHQSRVVS